MGHESFGPRRFCPPRPKRLKGSMMSDYILSCESTVDLTPEHLERREIPYIRYTYELDGMSYRDDLWQTITSEAFYRAMEEGAETKTSQINAAEYAEYFSGFLKAGKDVLHLCLSSGITGTINSARAAAEALREVYPERKICLVDSLAASSGFGLLVDKLADLRDGGMALEELVRWTEENKLRVHHWFFSTDLRFYIKGGRISKTAGTIGGLLGICPLLNVSADGRLIPREKVRSKKKVIQAIAEKMEMFADRGADYAEKCCLCHSACEEDARQVAELVEARFPKLRGRVEIFSIGPTIGSHTGPGTVALFFWGSPRMD